MCSLYSSLSTMSSRHAYLFCHLDSRALCLLCLLQENTTQKFFTFFLSFIYRRSFFLLSFLCCLRLESTSLSLYIFESLENEKKKRKKHGISFGILFTIAPKLHLKQSRTCSRHRLCLFVWVCFMAKL